MRAEHVLRERPVYAARKLHRANLPPWATRGTVIIAMGNAGICARNVRYVALEEFLKISFTELLSCLVFLARYMEKDFLNYFSILNSAYYSLLVTYYRVIPIKFLI